MSNAPQALISRKTGDWWNDNRRNWCAYCGIAIADKPAGETVREATRDHVVRRAHKGRHTTIPACKECNGARGASDLPEFMLTKYFESVRIRKSSNQWSLRDLWLAMALAAVEQARSVSKDWPSSRGRRAA